MADAAFSRPGLDSPVCISENGRPQTDPARSPKALRSLSLPQEALKETHHGVAAAGAWVWMMKNMIFRAFIDSSTLSRQSINTIEQKP